MVFLVSYGQSLLSLNGLLSCQVYEGTGARKTGQTDQLQQLKGRLEG